MQKKNASIGGILFAWTDQVTVTFKTKGRSLRMPPKCTVRACASRVQAGFSS